MRIQTDDDIIRSDLKSEDMRVTHPECPLCFDWEDHRKNAQRRQEYITRQDSIAFQTIKDTFPDFRPFRLKNMTLGEIEALSKENIE